MEDEQVIETALGSARDTRCLRIGAGATRETAEVFASLFGSASAAVVADVNTFEAAGREVYDILLRAGQPCAQPFVFGPEVSAEWQFVERLREALSRFDAVPIAVGSGTINDLTKLVAHRLNQPYMAVATAASMDGYTAFGASITYQGSKQTFHCPAPRAVIADLDVIARAPEGMNAAGYADLLAKCAAGADWILADAAGVEAIQAPIWEMVQARLRSWLASPAALAQRDLDALRGLISGLLVTGFAMQAARSSRPASGADHQFSHLWDMQHHTFNGSSPSHGFKVGIGTLASLALYEQLLGDGAGSGKRWDIDIQRAVDNWPSPETLEACIDSLFDGQLAAKAKEETRAKYIGRDELRAQLVRLHENWPQLRRRLARQLLSFAEARDMLRAAGCPSQPEQVGVSRPRLRLSYRQAYFIRRRFTVLDFAERCALLEAALEDLFSPEGIWAEAPQAETCARQGAAR